MSRTRGAHNVAVENPTDDAQARASRTRRNSLLGTAVAVIGVLVPGAILISRAPDSPDPAERSVSGPPSSSISSSSSTPTLTSTPTDELEQLDLGPAPRIGYVDGEEYVAPDGERTSLPTEGGISAITPYRGGFLIIDALPSGRTPGLHLVNGAGVETSSACTSGAPVVSRDGVDTAWVTREACDFTVGTIHRAPTDPGRNRTGGEEAVQYTGQAITLAGFIGDRVVFSSRSGAWVTDLVNLPRQIPGLSNVAGVDDTTGRVAGQSLDPRTASVVDADSGAVLWSAPGLLLSAFSPDGRYLLANQQREGRGGCCVRVILEADTGAEVARVERSGPSHGPTLSRLVWEDDTHLIGTLHHDGRHVIIRVGLDGHLSRATEVAPVGDRPSYVFVAVP